MSVLALSDLKLRLNKASGITVDDTELQSMLDAAERYYVRVVGPLPGTYTERFTGCAPFQLASDRATVITAAAYSDGTTVATGDLDLNTYDGSVEWSYGIRATFYAGTGFRRYLTITYTVGSLPADHAEVILADVAGYFEATQNNNGSANFPGEGYEQGYTSTPQVLFPRIRALAATYPKVG